MKLDLRKDKEKLRRYVETRIKDYPKSENIGPGKKGDPVSQICFGFYAEQGGYVNLVLDTRTEPQVDGEWTLHIDNDVNMLAFPEWLAAYRTIADGGTVSVVQHDGKKCKLEDSDGDEGVNRVFGAMIVALMLELKGDGTFKKLPLGSKAFVSLEEFDGRYAWPLHPEICHVS